MSKKLLLIFIAAVVVLAGAGAGGYFVFFRSTPEEVAGEQPAEADTSRAAGLVPLETFLVNINDPDGERYAKVQLQLTVVPDSVVSDIAEDTLLMAQMRDRVLTLLSAKSFEELSSPIGKEGVRREIKARLDPLLPEGEIQEVLFQDFLVQ